MTSFQCPWLSVPLPWQPWKQKRLRIFELYARQDARQLSCFCLEISERQKGLSTETLVAMEEEEPSLFRVLRFLCLIKNFLGLTKMRLWHILIAINRVVVSIRCRQRASLMLLGPFVVVNGIHWGPSRTLGLSEGVRGMLWR